MKVGYWISVVIFASEEQKLEKTYNSIAQQAFSSEQIQIVPVILSSGMENGSLLERLEKQENVTVLRAWETYDILEQLKSVITGTYVTFQKAGIVYQEQAMNHIKRLAEKSASPVIIGTIKNMERINWPMQEHNLYCKRHKKHADLNQERNLLHSMYFAYFIKKENVSWQNTFETQIWCLEVLKVIYATVFAAGKVSCVKEICLMTESGEQAFEDWELFLAEDRLEIYFRKFLEPIQKISHSDYVKCKENAEYALIYYIIRFVNTYAKYGNIAQSIYDEKVREMLLGITCDNAVVSNRYLPRTKKLYILQNIQKKTKNDHIPDIDVVLGPEYTKIEILFFELREQKLHIEFSVEQMSYREYDILCGWEEEEELCEKSRLLSQIDWGGQAIGAVWIYETDIPLEQCEGKICWKIRDEKSTFLAQNVMYGKYTPFAKKVCLYKRQGDRLFYLNKNENSVIMKPYGIFQNCYLLLKRDVSFIKEGKSGCKAVVARLLFEWRKRRQSKSVWLLSDRTNRADDNGEVMFEYLRTHAGNDIEPYFVIDKDTDDWKRMGKVGRVVEPFSKEHKILFLLSEFLLSSQANKAVVNPFGRLEYYYRDLMHDKRLVFLQHGITKDNQSRWLNKYNRNLFGFVVTTRPEYDSVFEYDYFYTPERVWLTGMPRYDKLYHDEKKYVTIMPTWRKNLSDGTDAQGVWLLGKGFKDSRYFNFYNKLLNHERLLDAAEKRGYRICFMPHPNTVSGIHYFKHDSRVLFMDSTYSYRDVFAQTDLMVTDYSSVAFDFAYLRKPIVYCQFDKEEFFNGEHSYTEGYFDYERDGFGEVEETLESAITRIIEYMDAGCKVKPLYLDRIENTFAFSDKNCCRRVYETVLKYRYE